MALCILSRCRGARCLLKCVITKVFRPSARSGPARPNACVMLDYVGYKRDDLRRLHRARVGAVNPNKREASRLDETLEIGPNAYTFLSDEPLA